MPEYNIFMKDLTCVEVRNLKGQVIAQFTVDTRGTPREKDTIRFVEEHAALVNKDKKLANFLSMKLTEECRMAHRQRRYYVA